MTQIYRFYLVTEDGTVEGTDSVDIATAAKNDGSTTVVEPGAEEYTFDNDVQAISVADDDDWLDSDKSDLDDDDSEDDN
jgi:hypothetical protein